MIAAMGFLSSIFNRKPKERFSKPDLDSAPHVKIDFSGIQIEFLDAPHNAHFPIHDKPRDLDIYDEYGHDFICDENYRYRKIYVTGCDFVDRLQKEHAGGLIIESTLVDYGSHYCKETNTHSLCNRLNFFTPNDLFDWILDDCHNMWGKQNGASKIGDLGDGTYVYPISSDELSITLHNGCPCVKAYIDYVGMAPEFVYFFPISKRHLIVLEMKCEAYIFYDFYDPTLPLEAYSYEVMERFMKDFKITLSDRSKKELAAARPSIMDEVVE
ncbi:hypothetical protein [Marinibactrum halimedae]|uniref:Uncharacterized protein n=1 Tax=Marinibactrum halimedae TaxID=1444977 RepID=A0AA37WLX6_9GAMM|nr:hypothetical protein [Marinibactrum halimedae]MCD9458578.1 hypothetical protein [Marinibactrum halimedae]GLS26554.1 hypothetical protein GCM10007877_22700 [Marinibactrum halimedae]